MDPTSASGTGWQPDRAWADPLLALLAALSLLLSGLVLRNRAAPAPAVRAGLPGRLAELPFAAERILGDAAGFAGKPADPARLARSVAEPWDRAVVAVLAAEKGDPEAGLDLAQGPLLPGPAGAAFRRCWNGAYGSGVADAGDRAQVRTALGDGWAAGLLEARLAELEGQDGAPILRRALDRCTRRILVAGGLVLVGLAAALAGVGVLLALLFGRRRAAPPFPAPPCSGRALALVFLGWFLGLHLAAALVAPLLVRAPFLRGYALPLTYALHAGWGTLLLRLALGEAWPGFWKGLWPRGRKALAWGLAHLAMAVPLVFAASWLAGPLTRRFPAPQRDLVEFLAGLSGNLPNLAAVLTVVGLAPLFEELLFRGVLLPALARWRSWRPAILISGLLFGAIHLQPAGLPTLATLGILLGFAARRGGGLAAPVLVHALWNGAVFLLLRAMVP